MALNDVSPPLPKQSQDRSPPAFRSDHRLFVLKVSFSRTAAFTPGRLYPLKRSTKSEFRTIDEGSQYVFILS